MYQDQNDERAMNKVLWTVDVVTFNLQNSLPRKRKCKIALGILFGPNEEDK